MPGSFKLPGLQSHKMENMDSYPQTKKCASCGLFLSLSDFYKNKSKNSGFHDRCKDCMYDYKKKQAKGLIQKQEAVKRDIYFIPNIYLVGYGRSQVYQNCCLNCSTCFFCTKDVREFEDLYCDDCIEFDAKLPEANLSTINYVGNVIGWISKVESIQKVRNRRNYKKVYHRDRFTCRYCAYSLQNSTKFLPLHIDHIKPWSLQGGNSMENLVVSCQECNLIAMDKWFKSFDEKKEYITFERQKRIFRRERTNAADIQSG